MARRDLYYLQYDTFRRNTAGYKAPGDVYQICRKEGYHRVTMPAYPHGKSRFYIRRWLLTVGTWNWILFGKKVPKQAIVLCQHPQQGSRLAVRYIRRYQKQGIRFIVLIHDLESLRGGIKGVVLKNRRTNSIGDNQLLKLYDAVICHNKYMRKYLVSTGLDERRLVDLEIFDYLSKTDPIPSGKSKHPSICIAGNLAKTKSGYISKIHSGGNNRNLTVHLYGILYEPEDDNERLLYHGSYEPDELAEHLEGDFGLVWDGTEASTCSGNTGEYLKYNNPHKASLYLSAGIPVIVWRQAAIADYVLEQGVGIVVDNLYSLDAIISGISAEEYQKMVSAARSVSQKLRSGYYTISAIREAVSRIQQ